MSEKRCRECRSYTQHKPYRTGLFKYEGEKVLTCKYCGTLRTNSEERVPESQIIYIPTQTKKRDMENEK